jgi:hypothetical protein
LYASQDLLGFDEGLLGDKNSVEELTLILAANSADLLDLGAAERKGSVVDSVEDDLTLDFVRVAAGGATHHLDDLILLSTKEVLDGDLGSVLGDDDVDREMSVNESHFVAEAL